MIAVITGDIINSRTLPEQWIATLKETLSTLPEPKSKWDIFRGDSFQVELAAPDALLNTIYIKAAIKTLKQADVRMAIGLGEKSIDAVNVAEANGEAFINSGEAFDTLKQNKANLALKTPWPRFDDDMNLSLRLALIAMDNWSQTSAQIVKYAIENRNTKQDKIAKIAGKSQSSISEALKRAHYSDIMDLESKYRTQVSQLINS
jgi:predicted XRE-type DNA-binding protein